MKLLIASESYGASPDGSAVSEERLALGLSSLGHDVTVWAPSARRSSDRHCGRIAVRRQRSLPTVVDDHRVALATGSQARRLMAQLQPDCLHINGPAMIGRAALVVAKQMGIPTVGTNHLMPENLLFNLLGRDVRAAHPPIWRYLAEFYNGCDHVTAPTKTARAYLVEAGLSRPTDVISNGVDTDVFRPDGETLDAATNYGIHSFSGMTLLYLGRVNREKRLDVLVRTLPLILREVSARLIIAGTGNSETGVRKLAKRLGVSEHVVMPGHIQEKDKPDILRSATFFVMPSPAELQSIATLEAMACGLPILVADAGALPEVCGDGVSGRVFPAADHQQLARTTVTLYRHPSLVRDMRARGRATAVREHSHGATVRKYLGVYQAAVEARQLRRGCQTGST